MSTLDPRKATWVSHSSLRLYLTCPRAYYLANLYRNENGKKIGIISPPLALGQAVHDVLESLSVLNTDERLNTPLLDKFNIAWNKVSGQLGGFSDRDQELEYKQRGQDMLLRVEKNPGVLTRKAVKLKTEASFALPNFWLSEKDNIILCGKIDWLEYLEDTDSVHIVDFKTGKHDEDGESLQLPIYLLLVANMQKRNAAKASYWYIDREDEPREVKMPELDEAYEKVLKAAKKVKLARELRVFKCPKGEAGCRVCRPYETVVRGGGTFVGPSDMGQDMYTVPTNNVKLITEKDSDDVDSVIL